MVTNALPGIGTIANAARAGLCQVFDINDNVVRLAPGTLIAPAIRVYRDLANLLRLAACGIPPTTSPVNYGADFSGGQCVARYNLRFSYQPVGGSWAENPGIGTNTPRIFETIRWGPIVRVTPVRTAVSNSSDVTTWSISSFDRGNGLPVNSTPGPPNTEALLVASQLMTPRASSLYVKILSITRADGLADNCGNPPPITLPPPPNGITVNRQVTFTENSVNVTVPMAFTYFQAQFIANNQIEIPFTFAFNPDVTFSGTINLGTGDINFNLGPTLRPPGEPPTLQPPPPPPPSQDLEDIENILNDTNNTVNEINNKTTNVNETVNRLEDKLDTLPEQLSDDFEELKNILECIDSLIRQINCSQEIERGPKSLIAEGTAIVGDSVVRLPIGQRNSILYGLEVETSNEFRDRVYKLDSDPDDMEAAFGNACFEYESANSGGYTETEIRIAFRKFTVLQVSNPIILPTFIRLSLRAGLAWKLYDLNVKIRTKDVISCFPVQGD